MNRRGGGGGGGGGGAWEREGDLRCKIEHKDETSDRRCLPRRRRSTRSLLLVAVKLASCPPILPY